MIYDGFDFTGLLRVEAIRRPMLAPVEVQTLDTYGRDGAMFAGSTLEPLTLETDVRFVAKTEGYQNQALALEDLRRNIAPRLRRDHPCRLVLDDAPDIYNMAILEGTTDLEKITYSKSGTLYWLCTDPAGYGAEIEKSSSTGELTCNVVGNYPTAPVVTMTGTGKAMTVTFDGQDFEITESVKNYPIVIDSANHTVTQEGVAVRVSIFSDYPVWEQGSHKVKASVPVTVRWAERWL